MRRRRTPSPDPSRLREGSGEGESAGMPRHFVSEEQRSIAKRLRREQTALESRLWHELRAKRLDGSGASLAAQIARCGDRYKANFFPPIP